MLTAVPKIIGRWESCFGGSVRRLFALTRLVGAGCTCPGCWNERGVVVPIVVPIPSIPPLLRRDERRLFLETSCCCLPPLNDDNDDGDDRNDKRRGRGRAHHRWCLTLSTEACPIATTARDGKTRAEASRSPCRNRRRRPRLCPSYTRGRKRAARLVTNYAIGVCLLVVSPAGRFYGRVVCWRFRVCVFSGCSASRTRRCSFFVNAAAQRFIRSLCSPVTDKLCVSVFPCGFPPYPPRVRDLGASIAITRDGSLGSHANPCPTSVPPSRAHQQSGFFKTPSRARGISVSSAGEGDDEGHDKENSITPGAPGGGKKKDCSAGGSERRLSGQKRAGGEAEIAKQQSFTGSYFQVREREKGRHIAAFGAGL